ncbi:hypothetical protein CFP56_009476 [Quercus suber]|uniref:Uncharacterized protein n=1 Tax=Quercus suber TaxID=58331 RepID=A0AAW0L2C5_QUESU
MEEASETTDEMCLYIGYDLGSMAHDDAGPSHTFAHGDTSRPPSMRSDDTCPPTSPTTSPLPTGTAPVDVHGRDEMRFMPTPGAVPPEFVHTEFIQAQIPAPHQRLHTFRIGREGRNGHGHILLIVGLDMERYFDSILITYTSLYIFACVLFRQGETSQGTSEEKKTGMIFDGQE